MRFMLAALVAAFFMLAVPAAATVCWVQDRDEFAAALLTRLGQFPVFIGVGHSVPGADVIWIYEVHAAPNAGSWTAFGWSDETGQICLSARGPRWSADKET